MSEKNSEVEVLKEENGQLRKLLGISNKEKIMVGNESAN